MYTSIKITVVSAIIFLTPANSYVGVTKANTYSTDAIFFCEASHLIGLQHGEYKNYETGKFKFALGMGRVQFGKSEFFFWGEPKFKLISLQN